ncbi:transcription initiation factor IID, 18kD subunit-domain-containing protein [Cyathus striatus]|nr:transcription initiation factor IID, 18kD subunit-domain-containing protein [Cyathus striatus]
MSYTPYTPPGSHPPPTSATYPYGAYYHPAAHTPYGHPQTPGAYPYQAGHYQSGVAGYGWTTYPYSIPQHPQPAAPIQRASVHTTPAPATSQTQTRTATFNVYTPTYARESTSSANIGGRGSRRQSHLRGLFTKELRNLMYGFGDDRNPANDTVNVMEEILIEYITDICQQAGGPGKKSRLSIEDLRRVLSRPADAKKLARMEELLFMQEDIKRARAQFEESDMNNPKEF